MQYNKNYFIKFEKQEANNANPQKIVAYEFGQVSQVDVSTYKLLQYLQNVFLNLQ